MGTNLCSLETILAKAAVVLNVNREDLDWVGWVETFSGGGLVFGPGGASLTRAPVVAALDHMAGIMAVYVGGRYWRTCTFLSALGKSILVDRTIPRGMK